MSFLIAEFYFVKHDELVAERAFQGLDERSILA